METALVEAKLDFFRRIGRDRAIQSIGAGRTIRDLVDLMTSYVDQANIADYEAHYEDYLSNRQKEKDKRKPESFESPEPMVPDFSDIEAIACNVAIFKYKYNNKNWLQKIFTKDSPLDAKLNNYYKVYTDFFQTPEPRTEYFGEDVASNIIVAFNSDINNNSRLKAADAILEKSKDYINRMGTLLRLADKRESIHFYYYNKGMDLFLLNSKIKILTIKQTKEIAGYFQKQAAANGILFKTLYLGYEKLLEDPNPVEETEKKFQSFMDFYDKKRSIDIRSSPRFQL